MPPSLRYAVFDPTAHGEPVHGLSVVTALPEHAARIAWIDVEREGGQVETIIPLITGELAKIERGELQRYTCLGVIDGEIIAYARCGYRTADPAHPVLPEGWYLTGVNVMSRWRRRGIGSVLTTHRLDWLRGQTDTVYYFTSMENRASLAMHEQLGFRETASNVLTPGREQSRPGWLLEVTLQSV